MQDSRRDSIGTSTAEHRRDLEHRPSLSGVSVREADIEPVKGIRAIAFLFRGMATLLLLLMILQVFSAVTSTVAMSIGVLVAEAIKLTIFAGLLWGAGDLAVLAVKSHHDLRATKILVARLAYMVRQVGEADGKLTPEGESTRADRET